MNLRWQKDEVAKSIDLNGQREFISEIAESYSHDRWKNGPQIKNELESLFRKADELDLSKLVVEKSSVLELGAGSGVVLGQLQQMNLNAVGVEVVSEATKLSKDENVHSLINADGCSLPFSDNTFSLILLWGNTIGPIPGEENRINLLKEARRVLRSDGKLAISVLNRSCSVRRMMNAKEYHFHYHSQSSEWISSKAGYNRYYGVGELKVELKKAGYTRFHRLSGRCDSALIIIAD
jgi:SAM-dependent methyltransferase